MFKLFMFLIAWPLHRVMNSVEMSTNLTKDFQQPMWTLFKRINSGVNAEVATMSFEEARYAITKRCSKETDVCLLALAALTMLKADYKNATIALEKIV